MITTFTLVDNTTITGNITEVVSDDVEAELHVTLNNTFKRNLRELVGATFSYGYREREFKVTSVARVFGMNCLTVLAKTTECSYMDF